MIVIVVRVFGVLDVVFVVSLVGVRGIIGGVVGVGFWVLVWFLKFLVLGVGIVFGILDFEYYRCS